MDLPRIIDSGECYRMSSETCKYKDNLNIAVDGNGMYCIHVSIQLLIV